MAKNKYFVVFVMTLLLLFTGNSEAGWKFWKKDNEATTTTTTTAPILVNVQSPSPTQTTTTTREQTVSTVNTRTAATKAANPAVAIDAGITVENTRNNARSNRPNPGTEVGLDIVVPKPRQPGIGGNNQNYRDWAVNFAGAEDPSRNQPGASAQRPKINNNNSDQPNLSAVTPTPANVPTQRVQSTQPTQRTQPSPQSTPPTTRTTATRPTSAQPVQPHVTPGPTAPPSGRSGSTSPSTNSGKTWAAVAAGGSRPASPGGTEQRNVPERPSQSGQPNRLASSPESTLSSGVGTADLNKRTYSSNPTYSKGNTVTDEDLEKLSEALYIKETNNNANQYVTLNLQQKTTSSSPTDQAPQSLLTVNPQAFQISTIQRVLSIFDNYQLDTHTNEYISPAQREEESLLVDTFLSTNVMSTAMRFLADKGFVKKDYYEYKDTLRRIWFNLFSRGQGKIGSTGFEHVFMAETKQTDTGTEVLGLHNWIYFNAEETKRRVDYLGYIKKVDLGNKGSIIKMHAKFNGHDKPVTTMFIGTSPELEMALYTICFYTRPDGNCPVSLGGTRFNIVTHAFRYRGKNLIGTAYPDI